MAAAVAGAALLVAAVLLPLLLTGTGVADALLAGGVLSCAVVSALALRSAARARAQAEKVSGEIDILSQRLLMAEARLAARQQAGPPAPDPLLAEVNAEIGALSDLMRDLAVALAAQDGEIAALKRTDEAAPVTPSPGPSRAEPRPAEALAAPAAPIGASAPVPERAPPAAKDPLPAAPPARLKPDHDLIAMPPLRLDPPLEEAGREAAIVEAFKAERIELHLQPVVALPQRRVRFYEALARLRLADDTLLVPAEFLPSLERRGLAPDLDRFMLARGAAIARHLAARGSEAFLSCNLAASSLAEPGFLRAIGRLIDAYPDLPRRLVLELPQRSWRTLDAEQAGALAQLRDRGLAFALDRAADLRFDPLALADRGVRYVKLPADLLLRPETARRSDIAVGDLAAVLTRAGIRLVAERVEREEDVPDLIDLDVPLAQGFVFAPPRPVRNEVLAPAPAAAAPAPEPTPPAVADAPPVEPEERRPFRAFLRRAG